MWTERMLRVAALLLAVAATGCGLEDQEAPELAGPSEYGRSISVRATTDRLSQDGVSQIEVIASVRNEKNEPVPNFTVQWRVVASTGVLVEPSLQQSTTDAQGVTRIVVTAPPAPALLPTSTATLTITASEVGGDALATNNARTVRIQLIPPAGTLPPNRLPVPTFTVSPAVGTINETIRFDASLTTDEGDICDSKCSYHWNFGADFTTDTGMVVSHSWEKPATYTVTLTVIDPRGGVASTSRSVTISGPTAPIASFSATVGMGGVVRFNAAASSVGAGAEIETYAWDFGDGNQTTVETPLVNHTYGAAGDYFVTLTVTDDFGREAKTSAVVTIP
jgi:PKD repeat protein